MNTNNPILPPRGSKGRFMPKVPIARFTYWKPTGTSDRKIVVSPSESVGDYIKGFDLNRRAWRTFRRGSVVGSIKVKQEYLDTVSLETTRSL